MNPSPPRVLALVNPEAGGRRAPRRWRVWEGLLQEVTPYLEIFRSPSPGELRRMARERAQDFDWLLAVGGDGTANEVLNGLLESREEKPSDSPSPRLGLLPFGSGNDIARNLGLLEAGHLETSLRRGEAHWVDVLEARWETSEGEERIFALLTVGVGFGAEVLHCTSPWVKRRLGAVVGYSLGAVVATWRHRPTEMEVRIGEQVWRGPILFVACGNGEWEGGGAMRVSPGACMDDGWMNVSIIREASKWRILSKLPSLLNGSHIWEPEVDYLRAREVFVRSDPPVRLQVDGEVVGSTPVVVRLHPQAVPILGARPLNSQAFAYEGSSTSSVVPRSEAR